MSTQERLSVFPILLVNFIGTLGYSIVLPFLIILVLQLGGNELTYGLLGATYSFFQLIGAPVLGRWSDVYGRKRILLLSEIGTFIGWGIFLVALLIPQTHKVSPSWMFTTPLLLVFIARVVDGITGGNISVANAYLADITPKAERKKNFGKMSAAGNIGLIFGPALAGLLGATSLGISLPVIIAIIISLVAIIVISSKLKETKALEIPDVLKSETTHKLLGQEHKDCYNIGSEKQVSFSTVIRQPNVLFMLLLYFLIFLAFNFFYVAFPVYVARELQWSTFQIGIFFSILSGALVLIQGAVLTQLSKSVSGARLVTIGCVLLAVGFSMFTSASIVWLYCGLSLFAIGNGIMWPSFLAILSNISEERYQGTIQGFAGSAGSMASIFGLISGAFIYRVAGSNTFLLATAFMIIIAICSYRLNAIEQSQIELDQQP